MTMSICSTVVFVFFNDKELENPRYLMTRRGQHSTNKHIEAPAMGLIVVCKLFKVGSTNKAKFRSML